MSNKVEMIIPIDQELYEQVKPIIEQSGLTMDEAVEMFLSELVREIPQWFLDEIKK